MKAINIKEKFGLFDDQWSPRILAECNGQYVKIAKLEGEFIWHNHADEDELFLIVKGSLLLKFRDGEVRLNEGEFYVVPKGVDHLPIADEECWVLLVEPKGTKHTGEVEDERTVAEDHQYRV